MSVEHTPDPTDSPVYNRLNDDRFIREADETDGDVWTFEHNTMCLVAPNASYFGYVQFADFEPAKYIETTRRNETEVYTFTAGNHVAAVQTEYVRYLANTVFEVSYDTMKRHAHTIPNANIRGIPEGVTAVMFDLPDTQFRAIVAPVMESNDD